MKALLVLLALAGTAHADDRTDGIMTQPLAIVGLGASFGYEHLVMPQVSVVGLVGGRSAAMGDYTSLTLSTGAELRWWLFSGRTMRGLFLAAHASVGRTSLEDDTTGKGVGSNVELTERIDTGWRFVLWQRLTIAPSLGVGVHQNFDTSGHFAAYNVVTAVFGFEVGWLL